MAAKRMARIRDTYGDVLAELGETDERIVALTADLGGSVRTEAFGERFPDRYFNVGVAEANMMGVAAGLAMSGLRPFASTFAMFATGKPWEQVRQVIAYQNAPVRIVATHAGLTVGEDGASHQVLEDLNNMRVLPNMSVVVPADIVETEQVIRWAASYDEGPVYVRLSRAAFPVFLDELDYQFEFGKAKVLRRGTDVTIFATGLMTAHSLEAAGLLAGEGVKASVVNVSTIKPLDVETVVAEAARTGSVVTVEEHQVSGGLGSAICEALAEHEPLPVKRIGVYDEWGQSGAAYELLEHYGLTPGPVAKQVQAFVEKVTASDNR